MWAMSLCNDIVHARSARVPVQSQRVHTDVFGRVVAGPPPFAPGFVCVHGSLMMLVQIIFNFSPW